MKLEMKMEKLGMKTMMNLEMIMLKLGLKTMIKLGMTMEKLETKVMNNLEKIVMKKMKGKALDNSEKQLVNLVCVYLIVLLILQYILFLCCAWFNSITTMRRLLNNTKLWFVYITAFQ